MVNKCSVFGCNTNYNGGEKSAVFKIPKQKDLREKWFKFINRKDLRIESNFLFVCQLHFEEDLLNKDNKERVRLIKPSKNNNINYIIPTIHPESLKNKSSILPHLIPPRKQPYERIFRKDEIHCKSYEKLLI